MGFNDAASHHTWPSLVIVLPIEASAATFAINADSAEDQSAMHRWLHSDPAALACLDEDLYVWLTAFGGHVA